MAPDKGAPSAASAAASIAVLAPALETVAPSAAALIRRIALDLHPVAYADGHGLRLREVDQLRQRVERQAGKALEAYLLVSDSSNNDERVAVVLGILHQAAALLPGTMKALDLARRNIVGLTAARFSDKRLLSLLSKLARPASADPELIARAKGRMADARYLSMTKRLDACLPLLRVLGLCPNSRERGNEVETLRKKMRGVMKERQKAFGFAANGRATKHQKTTKSRHSGVTAFGTAPGERSRHGTPPKSNSDVATSARPRARPGRGSGSDRRRA